MKRKNAKDINPYEVRRDLFPKKKKPNPKDVNPYETHKINKLE
jgi:hypothetical protein